MKRSIVCALLLILVLLAGVLLAHEPTARAAQAAPFQLVEVASGFDRPLYLTHANDGSGRLFVVEQGGKIWIVQNGARLDTPFLDVSGLISPEALSGGYSERGLLGLAFHPDYASNGYFFINYTDQKGNTMVARYSVSADDPNLADPNSAVPLLYVEQPYPNHNGGHLAFGPDGYLYIALGDGGSGGDPQGNGQNLMTLLGSILRIDINADEGYAIPDSNPFAGRTDARPEIWAYGLRNPWRFSFDRGTGDLYIGDVGQGTWEEIDYQPADSPGGENYGWNLYEGNHPYAGGGDPGTLVMPIAEYSHDSGGCSVSGGYVYRGSAVPALQGLYLYGDWCSGTIWSLQRDASGAWQNQVALESGRSISSFGEDEAGELYVLDYSGAILQVAAGQ